MLEYSKVTIVNTLGLAIKITHSLPIFIKPCSSLSTVHLFTICNVIMFIGFKRKYTHTNIF